MSRIPFYNTEDEKQFINKLFLKGNRLALENYVKTMRLRKWDRLVDSEEVYAAAESALGLSGGNGLCGQSRPPGRA